ncbi:MAG: recombination-associated protein RdgC [Zoogloeaceae bacterium]|jgi:recombination associated protein RdgC|nr:recombination-associated protein RdgC [Zoogloeaceae bacterium]
MWFRNLQPYRLPRPWDIAPDVLEARLQRGLFHPCGSLDAISRGWSSPRDAGLVHAVGGHWFLQLTVDERLLPAAVVRQEVTERAARQAEAQGYPPGRKTLREMKERVIEELLPRAFTRRRRTHVWIDPGNGWLGVDAGSLQKAEEALEALRDCLDGLPLALARTRVSPATAMANWLASGEAPAGFTIDRDCELKSTSGEKSVVRYVRHPLDGGGIGDEIRAHLSAGKSPARLALTWDDRLSFLLTEKGEIRRLAFLDVVREETDNLENAEDIFDAECALQAGEFARFLPALFEALGGEIAENAPA